MSGFSRIAVGSLGEQPDPGPICWALAGCLERTGRRVRHFLSRACYGSPQGAVTSTGRASQHLDSWLSSIDSCRAQLAEAYASAEFVLVEGQFPSTAQDDRAAVARTAGGDLATLAHRLDLPRIVILDSALAANCRLPARPEAVDGVILDGVFHREHFVRMQTCVEGAWGVPVVAALELDEGLRQQLVCLPPGRTVSQQVVNSLTHRMAPYLQFETLNSIAARSTLPQPSAPCRPPSPMTQRPTVALAFDDAFCGYFADVLERLEQLGATIVAFSPLADEALPDDVDVVLIGCGKPEAFAERLTANHCMRAALRNFARCGGSIYSEGGGTAYLSRSLQCEGRALPMVDALPLAASVLTEPEPWEPVEFVLERHCRLGPRGLVLRGYRGGGYRFDPLEPCDTPAAELPRDLFSCGNVVGGRMQLHFIAQPQLLRGLFERRGRNKEGLFAGVS